MEEGSRGMVLWKHPHMHQWLIHTENKQQPSVPPQSLTRTSWLKNPEAAAFRITASLCSQTLCLHLLVIHIVSCSSRLLWEVFKLILYGPCEWNAYSFLGCMPRGEDHFSSMPCDSDLQALITLVPVREVVDNVPHCDFWSLLFLDPFREVQNFRMKIHKVIVSSGWLFSKTRWL